jgi:hypothetical protein
MNACLRLNIKSTEIDASKMRNLKTENQKMHFLDFDQITRRRFLKINDFTLFGVNQLPF